MVTGPLRAVLWILGSLGMLWLALWLVSTAIMGGAIGGWMAGNGVAGGDGMMDGSGMVMNGAFFPMMGAMFAQFVGMTGLAGIFVYLVVDALRARSGRPRGDEEVEK